MDKRKRRRKRTPKQVDSDRTLRQIEAEAARLLQDKTDVEDAERFIAALTNSTTAASSAPTELEEDDLSAEFVPAEDPDQTIVARTPAMLRTLASESVVKLVLPPTVSILSRLQLLSAFQALKKTDGSHVEIQRMAEGKTNRAKNNKQEKEQMKVEQLKLPEGAEVLDRRVFVHWVEVTDRHTEESYERLKAEENEQ